MQFVTPNENDAQSILDASVFQNAPHMQRQGHSTYRKDSLLAPNGPANVMQPMSWSTQSPQFTDEFSQDHAMTMPSPFAFNAAASAFQPHHHHMTHQMQHHPHQMTWQANVASGSCTPTMNMGFVSPTVGEARLHHSPHDTNGPHDHVAAAHNLVMPAGPMPFNPVLPDNSPSWPGQYHDADAQPPRQKRVRIEEPVPDPPLYNKDAVRKKNNRIDIPPERDVETIERMLEVDDLAEPVKKELKQQKRLLRNREAALQSRQRKKKHTENLEIKEKDLENKIHHLEEEVEHLTQQLAEQARVIEALEEDKSRISMEKDAEIADMRRKINVLTEQVDSQTAPSMSAAPSSTGFAEFSSEMAALNVEQHGWNPHDMSFDAGLDHPFLSASESLTRSPMIFTKVIGNKSSTSPTVVQARAGTEKSSANVAYFLLMLGAFFASRPSDNHTVELINLPENVRQAAPVVLDHLLTQQHGDLSKHDVDFTSIASRDMPPPSAPSSSGIGTRPNCMDRLHRTLTAPTIQQELDHALAVTTNQFTSLEDCHVPLYLQSPPVEYSHSDVLHVDPHLLTQPSPAADHDWVHVSPDTELHTRSILMAQIPSPVVHRFKEVVRARHNHDMRNNRRMPPTYQSVYSDSEQHHLKTEQ